MSRFGRPMALPVMDPRFVSEKPLIVDFWAPRCGPCKSVGGLLEELAASRPDQFELIKINVDDEPELAARFGVRSIPTLVAMRSGRVTHQMVGFSGKARFERWFAEALER